MEELGSSFETAGVSWNKMKQGFLDMEKNYPGSLTILNNFYKYACFAGDKETMNRLYNKIGDNWYSEIWVSKDVNYDKCRDMAGIKGKSWKQIYEDGDSLERKQIFRLAQEGDPKYQYWLGCAYEEGKKGFSKDYGKELEWLQKSADQGYPDAQARLGGMYINGTGVKRDLKKSIELHKLAAEQGDCSAAHVVAFLYNVGKADGIESDKIQQYAWLAQCNGDTKELRGKMSDTELQKAREEAEKIKKRIASKPKIFDPSWEGSGKYLQTF
jgi:TPR repeat protein